MKELEKRKSKETSMHGSMHRTKMNIHIHIQPLNIESYSICTCSSEQNIKKARIVKVKTEERENKSILKRD